MKRILIIVLMALVVTIPLFSSGAEETPKYVFKATTSHCRSVDSAELLYLDILKETLESETNGRVRVDIYPSEQLGNQTEMVQGVQAGTIEIATPNYAILNSYFPETILPTVPGFLSDAEEVNAIMSGPWGQDLHERMEKATGIKVLSSLSNGFRCFTSNKPLSTVDSIKGQTFRVMQNQLSVQMVEALGAHAVPMASGEMYQALQNGIVDGQENPVNNILVDKTYEVQKYMVMDNHMASMCAFIMNANLYNSLPDDIRQALDNAVEKAEKAAIDAYVVIESEGIKKLQDYGLEIYFPTADELIAWQTPIMEATESYARDTLGDAPVDEFKAVIQDYRANH